MIDYMINELRGVTIKNPYSLAFHIGTLAQIFFPVHHIFS